MSLARNGMTATRRDMDVKGKGKTEWISTGDHQEAGTQECNARAGGGGLRDHSRLRTSTKRSPKRSSSARH
jgi:hypothetical protein